MSLKTRIEKTLVLSQQEKVIMGILAGESMTANQLVGCLMSDPYDMTFDEVFNGIKGLRDKALIEIKDFRKKNNFEIETYLTFAIDWVCKIP